MKQNNNRGSISKRSTQVSCLKSIPHTTIPYSLPTNYVNKTGKNPNIGDFIFPTDIVFSKEELTDNKWLLTTDNEDVKSDTKKALETWIPRHCWIVIQSQEEADRRRGVEKERMEKLSKERDEIERGRKENMENFKIDIDPLAVDPKFIKAKYFSLEEFERDNSGGSEIIKNNYQEGDEIWYYSEFYLGYTIGTFKANFVLVRNNKIICSPIIAYSRCCYSMSSCSLDEIAKRNGLK